MMGERDQSNRIAAQVIRRSDQSGVLGPTIARPTDTEPGINSFLRHAAMGEVRVLSVDNKEGELLTEVPTHMILRDPFAAVNGDDVREIARTGKIPGELKIMAIQGVDGRERLKIVDGFHRREAAEILGTSRMTARVRIGRTPENLIDARIHNIQEHPELGFSRLAIWAQDAWALSPLSGIGISFSEALHIAQNENVLKTKVPPRDRRRIIDWVDEARNAWRVPLRQLHEIERVAELLSSSMVLRVRVAAQVEGGCVTIPQAKEIAELLPGKFHAHETLLWLIDNQHLTSPQEVSALCRAMSRVRENSYTEAITQFFGRDVTRQTRPTTTTQKAASTPSQAPALPKRELIPSPTAEDDAKIMAFTKRLRLKATKFAGSDGPGGMTYEDFASETMARLIGRYGVEILDKDDAWRLAGTIMINLHADQGRSKIYEKETTLGQVSGGDDTIAENIINQQIIGALNGDPHSSEQDPELAAVESTAPMVSLIRTHLELLTDEQKITIKTKYLSQPDTVLTDEEVARLLGLNLQVVKSRLHRGRLSLKRSLTSHGL